MEAERKLQEAIRGLISIGDDELKRPDILRPLINDIITELTCVSYILLKRKGTENETNSIINDCPVCPSDPGTG